MQTFPLFGKTRKEEFKWNGAVLLLAVNNISRHSFVFIYTCDCKMFIVLYAWII